MNERVSEPASYFGNFMDEYQARIMGHAKVWKYTAPSDVMVLGQQNSATHFYTSPLFFGLSPS